MKKVIIRIGLIMCLPFIYLLCVYYNRYGFSIMLIPCTFGGTGFIFYVVFALAIGLYLLITGGGKDEQILYKKMGGKLAG